MPAQYPFRRVAAECPGANGTVEVLGKGWMNGLDFADGAANAPGDGSPGTIADGVKLSNPLAEAQGFGKMVGELIEFG
jgi:hypothetical protein